MRALVVYYSWTGNTAKVAKAVAAELGADLEEIGEVKPRKGRFAQFRCALDSMFQLRPRICSSDRNLAAYDLIVVGTPVWARKMAGPVRTWFGRSAGKLSVVAAFCTEAGAGGETVIDAMSQAAGRTPVAKLIVRQSQLNDSLLPQLAAEFARNIAANTKTLVKASTAA